MRASERSLVRDSNDCVTNVVLYTKHLTTRCVFVGQSIGTYFFSARGHRTLKWLITEYIFILLGVENYSESAIWKQLFNCISDESLFETIASRDPEFRALPMELRLTPRFIGRGGDYDFVPISGKTRRVSQVIAKLSKYTSVFVVRSNSPKNIIQRYVFFFSLSEDDRKCKTINDFDRKVEVEIRRSYCKRLRERVT